MKARLSVGIGGGPTRPAVDLCHGFDSLLPDWEVAEQLFALQGRALRRAFYAAA
jgi:hypothetical protein